MKTQLRALGELPASHGRLSFPHAAKVSRGTISESGGRGVLWKAAECAETKGAEVAITMH
jgi:hypothetical protein